jgi:hypothetical protein
MTASKEHVPWAWNDSYRSFLNSWRNREHDDSYYFCQFLIEAYVHGLIDGEAIEPRNAKHIRARELMLR